MSKYDPLWSFVQHRGEKSFVMTFDEVRDVLGFEIDHSFLTFKKELLGRGYRVGKISLKARTVSFESTELTGDEP